MNQLLLQWKRITGMRQTNLQVTFMALIGIAVEMTDARWLDIFSISHTRLGFTCHIID